MARSRWLPSFLLATGILFLLAALALLVAAWTAPAQGLEDLGRVVGAILLAVVAGVPFAGYLLALRLPRARRAPRAGLALATLGTALAAAMTLVLLQTAVSTGNLWLALVMAAPGALFVGGLGSSFRFWRGGGRAAA